MKHTPNHLRLTPLPLLCALVISGLYATDTHAEYGDVVLNNFSSDAGVRPVIFSHWFHRIRYSCKSCHSELGIVFKAGATKIDMATIVNGEYCGACHNGVVAWSIENCDLCHSAKSDIPTQVHMSTQQILLKGAAK